ncbi:DUF4837 family protein [Maribacter algarum]|uniref:DUF4837 family protein n=1 Tax=Maribacter algarum (ex Zhang et al. 2020) TaxID=2578118 RepID=A0A5S3Q053_9FLAO|nr:DUF4837 family protein [Maribacter algarum]TMM58967.1 DUF4837 family protein [Maribacter algarum]
MKTLRTLLFLAFVGLVSCNNGKSQNYLPRSIGPVNQVTLVMDNDLWKGRVGDKIREHFAATAVGLTWEESILTLNQVPPKVFAGSLLNSKSILLVKKDTAEVAELKSDIYATPQRMAVFKGQTDEEIMNNIEAMAEEIIASYKAMDLKETQTRLLKSLNKEGVLEEKFNITMSVPSIYKVGRQEDNFVWMDREIQKGHMNIIAYEMPANSFSADSTLVREIVQMRDSIGALYIPGPDVPNKTTHMRTEPAFSPSIFSAEIAGRKAIEVRGIWDIKNYPMAGPFITYIIDDEANNRKLVVEGFTFAPATNKRDDMFRLEAIMKTTRFTN